MNLNRRQPKKRTTNNPTLFSLFSPVWIPKFFFGLRRTRFASIQQIVQTWIHIGEFELITQSHRLGRDDALAGGENLGHLAEHYPQHEGRQGKNRGSMQGSTESLGKFLVGHRMWGRGVDRSDRTGMV